MCRPPRENADMKLRPRIAVCMLALLPTALMAQVPTELLGGGNSANDGKMANTPFYKDKEGIWVLSHKAVNDGYQCSVSFITETASLKIAGPWDADMAKKGDGMLWFNSKDIPQVKAPKTVRVTFGNGLGNADVGAYQIPGSDGQGGVFILSLKFDSVLKDKSDTAHYTIGMDGKSMVDIKPIAVQAAYRRLKECMAVRVK